MRKLKAFRHAHALNPAEAIRLGKAWDGIPLAIQWSIARTKSNAELLAQAEVPIGRRLHGEQLLEFSFRRIFEQFTAAERAIMEVISILESPMPTEAIVAAVGGSDRQSLDALEELVDDAMVSRIFDPKRNDYCFTVMPITRAFLRNDLGSRPHVLKRMQRRLTDWYEAKEVTDGEERLVVRELRTGGSADDSALVDLALAADRRGDLENAGKLFKQALRRNPRSWRAAHAYAEFERHRNNNNLEALTLYSIAGANAPRQGNERAIIFREWGLLLRDSGQPDATAKAEETLKLALEASPSDAITRHALGTCYERRGAWRAVIEVLSPLRNSRNQKTRRQSLPILLRAYEHTHEILAAAELRRDLEET
jgi:tetratricopeptide (TPR) repeat protein